MNKSLMKMPDLKGKLKMNFDTMYIIAMMFVFYTVAVLITVVFSLPIEFKIFFPILTAIALGSGMIFERMRENRRGEQ